MAAKETVVEKNDDASLAKANPWQDDHVGLVARFHHLLKADIHTDVRFAVGDERKLFSAHRLVLAASSPVFDTMFYGAMSKESAERADADSVISLPDVEPEAFRTCLAYVYHQELELNEHARRAAMWDKFVTVTAALDTLYVAKKYQIRGLETGCREVAGRHLNADNACLVLQRSRQLSEAELAEKALCVIADEAPRALQSGDFTRLDLDSVCAILERDGLYIREVALFTALVNWALEECKRRIMVESVENKRAVLGRGLHLIRYPLMNQEEFAEVVVKSGLLADGDIIDVFMLYSKQTPKNMRFSSNPRRGSKPQVEGEGHRIISPAAEPSLPNMYSAPHDLHDEPLSAMSVPLIPKATLEPMPPPLNPNSVAPIRITSRQARRPPVAPVLNTQN